MTKSSFDTPSPCLPAQPTARRPTMQTPLQPGPKVIFCVRGAISPLLANIFLHVVLDRWFEDEVRPRMAGDATLVRFADDFVMTFETHHDAKRVLEVLGKRLGRYGLTLHPDKTRFIDFRPDRRGGTHPDCGATIKMRRQRQSG